MVSHVCQTIYVPTGIQFTVQIGLRTPLSISPLLQHSFHTKGNCKEKDYWRWSSVLNLGFLSFWLCATTGYSRINLPIIALEILLDLNPKFMHEWDFGQWWSANWDWQINMMVGLSWIFEKMMTVEGLETWHFDLWPNSPQERGVIKEDLFSGLLKSKWKTSEYSTTII